MDIWDLEMVVDISPGFYGVHDGNAMLRGGWSLCNILPDIGFSPVLGKMSEVYEVQKYGNGGLGRKISGTPNSGENP